MVDINIDEICEPIKVKVGGKDYTVADISREILLKMTKMARNARIAEETAKAALEAGEEPVEDKSTEEMAKIMAEVLGAEEKEIIALGMRKLNTLVIRLMNTINEELEGKNVPKVAPTK